MRTFARYRPGKATSLPLPLYMVLYGNIAGTAGLPLAALTVGAVLTRPFAGWSINVYGRKIIFFVGIILFLLPCVAFIFMITPFFFQNNIIK